MNYSFKRCACVAAALLAMGALAVPIRAWDSRTGNPTRPTHSLITNWALDQLPGATELQKFREAVIDGANTELHELSMAGKYNDLDKKYQIDLERKRVQYRGTNAGCDDLRGWWTNSLAAYQAGNKGQAYFSIGVILHMVQDMGVPAHAQYIYHQGNLTEFDNFEFLAARNWEPRFNDSNRMDPEFADPSKYYAFSQQWTHGDAPNYKDRNSFSKFWISASGDEKALVSNRQGRTCFLTKWTLQSAVKALK